MEVNSNKYKKEIMDNNNGLEKEKLRQGSHFPDEVYNFGEDEDNLPIFVEMLKNRGYYIGEDNHIRSKKGVLASKLMRNGYYMTSAQYDGKVYYFMEHRVIWVWNNGAIPKGFVINHKDYNRANNDIKNLEVVTQKENVEYSRCNMKPPVGEKSGKASFTDKQAKAIKTLGKVCGWSNLQISKLVNSRPSNISRIVNGKRYPNVIEASNILEIYPTVVDFTRNKSIGREEELKNYLLGLNGECGELTDIFKKVLYHGKDYDPIDVMLELGDILYYITAIANVLGIDMAEILLNNNAKLIARYKDGYSIKQSLERIEDKEHNVINGNGDNR